MFFIFFGTREKFLGKERRNVLLNGNYQMADISVAQNYFHLFWIPIIPIGRIYKAYLLDSGEFYSNGLFNKMPRELLEQCKEVGRRF